MRDPREPSAPGGVRADGSPRPRGPSPRAVVVGLAVAGFAAWAWWSASLAYDFADPTARAWLERDAPSYRLVLCGLPAGWPLVFHALLFLAGGMGLGHLALLPLRLRWLGPGERALVEVVAGLMAWSYLALAFGSAGLLRPSVFRVALAAGLAGAVVGWSRLWLRARACGRGDRGSDPETGRPGRLPVLLGLGAAALLGAFLVVALLGALSPELYFDGRWYHLAQVKHYLQRGWLYNMVAETRMAVVGLPAYHQLLLLAAGAAFDLRVAKLLPWFEGLIAVFGLVCVGRHHLSSRLTGVTAALVFVSIPLVSWFMATSANDLMVALLAVISIHAYLRWRGEPAAFGWLAVLGAVAGFAGGVKPFALASLLALLLGVAVDAWRRSAAGRRLRFVAARVLVVVGAAVAAVTPWLVRSYLTTGNPVFPFFDGVVFDSPYWNEVVETHYRRVIESYGVEQTLAWFLSLPVRTVTRANNHRAVIGPVLLLFAPVLAALVATARGAAGEVVRRLSAYAAIVVTLWFAGGLLETRYVAFVLPSLALLVAHAAVGHDWGGRPGLVLRACLAAALAAATVLNLHPFVPFQAHGTTVVCRAHLPWDYLYRGAPEESLTVAYLPMVEYLNRHLRPGVDKVYDGTKSHLVYFYLYNDVELFNGDGWDGPRGLGEWDLLSPEAPGHFVREGITHLVVASARWPERRLRASALWPALREVWRSPDHQVLYRFDATALAP